MIATTRTAARIFYPVEILPPAAYDYASVKATLVDIMASAVDTFGDQPFLAEQTDVQVHTIGFASFERRSRMVARALVARGAVPGAALVLAGQPSIDRTTVEMGAALAGLSVVSDSSSQPTAPRLGIAIDDTATVWISSAELVDEGERVSHQTARTAGEIERGLEDAAVFAVGDGRTVTQGDIVSGARRAVEAIGIAYGSRIALTRRIPWIPAWIVAYAGALVTGSVVTLVPANADPGRTIDEVRPQLFVIGDDEEERVWRVLALHHRQRRPRLFGVRRKRRSRDVALPRFAILGPPSKSRRFTDRLEAVGASVIRGYGVGGQITFAAESNREQMG